MISIKKIDIDVRVSSKDDVAVQECATRVLKGIWQKTVISCESSFEKFKKLCRLL